MINSGDVLKRCYDGAFKKENGRGKSRMDTIQRECFKINLQLSNDMESAGVEHFKIGDLKIAGLRANGEDGGLYSWEKP